jgi:flavin-dependent dehydrogenase
MLRGAHGGGMRIGIIGGGPGGAVAAATLARAGIAVDVYEREVFPRFHIGESLLPCNLPIYHAIGLPRPAFDAKRYMPKLGAHFEQVGTGRTVRFPFADALAGDPPGIYQVERARFDQMLLDHAVASGATLRCPATVERVDLDPARPVVHHDQGQTAYDFVIDASGRDTLIARQLGLVDREGDLMRAAVYGHVEHLPLAPNAQVGDIVISKCAEGWSWQIPLEPRKWSIGLVLKRDTVVKGGSPAEIFRNNLRFFPEVAGRLGGVIPDPVRTTPNISYRVRERAGRRWALIGDAGGFVDPIFSSGVLLATRAGWRLANEIIAGGPGADLRHWKQQTDHDLTAFTAFIRLWYDGHFIDNLFFGDVREDSIYRGIISMLAGNTTNADNAFLAMLMKRASAMNARG